MRRRCFKKVGHRFFHSLLMFLIEGLDIKVAILLTVYFFVMTPAHADDHIYTNEDLRPYEGSTHEKKLHGFEEEILLAPTPGAMTKEEKEKLNADREIILYLSKCPPSQDASDRSSKKLGQWITTKTRGRTVREICDTEGNGCQVCYEVTPSEKVYK